MYLFSTKQILQSGLRVKGNKNSSTFCNKSGNAVLLATSNLWGDIQIVRTYILKNNIFNPVSLSTRYLDFGTLHCHFRHISDNIICYVLNNIEDMKKICFSTQKHVSCSYTLEKNILT